MYVDWDIFPFDGDLRVKPLAAPVLPEPERAGAGGVDCHRCDHPDDGVIWSDDHWTLSSLPERNGLPVTMLLESRPHVDFPELDEARAAEFGRLSVQIARAIETLDGIARAHISKWGDGAEHLHVIFYGRPEGFSQLRGTCLALWDDILPAWPPDAWDANARRVADTLVERHGGRVHAS
ncbi:hypothetical protein BH23ACT10_BH23ACT10_34720 [soil metagenome]